MPDGIQSSGYIILFVGVGLLVFTFLNAYLFLKDIAGIAASPDLMEVFGGALAPLIEACIRAIYLGIMGWIGSILTIRGIHSFTYVKRELKAEAKPKTETPTQPTAEPTSQSFAQAIAQTNKKQRKGKKK